MKATSSFTSGGLSCTVVEPASGAAPRHTFVLAHALGCDRSMWDELVPFLAGDSRVVTYDQLGHGQSEAPPGPYDMGDLADRAARLIQALGGEPVVWIGLSMGGMVGQELALRHPQRVKALVLANTTSGYPPEAQQGWTQRIAQVRNGGLASIVDGALQRWFHEGFHRSQPEVVAHWRAKVIACDADAYIGACQAVAGIDTTARLQEIRVPVLVIAGELDLGTPPAMAAVIAGAINGARLEVLPKASHLSVLEQPAAFRSVLADWLYGLP